MSDLVIYAGDDRPIQWPLTDTEDRSLDVTGWSARAQVRAYPGAPVMHEWSTQNGRAVLAAGSVTLLVDDSGSWPWVSGQYDLFLSDPSARAERVDGGRVTVIPAVTRDE